MDDQHTIIEQRVRVLQIIAGALVMGVVLFLVVAIAVLGALRKTSAGEQFSLIAAGFAIAAWVLHLVLPGAMANAAASGDKSAFVEKLCTIYQGKTIIALALLEGAAFFNVCALLVEHNWWSLVVIGALLLQMLFEFPTVTRVRQWIETQQMNATN
ncbi:MAG: hypothetical protein ACK5Q5_13225 [Planctomycetaceae bacterium]